MNLTINRKLLISYLAMALLTVLAGVYAIYSLQRLNELAYRVINEDFAIIDQSKKLMDALIARESAEKRYLILRETSIAEVYRTRSDEFSEVLAGLGKIGASWLRGSLSPIGELNRQYNDLFNREVALIEVGQYDQAQTLSDATGRQIIDEIALHIRTMQRRAEGDIEQRMNLIEAQGLRASRITVLLSLVSLAAAFLIVLWITVNISRPLKRLETATTQIAEGHFDQTFRLNRADEIGSLSRAFESMAQRLKILEEKHLDASPLTGLPGNRAIEREIERRLGEKRLFALCHIDLDNFKPFVDKYGYAWGSEVIKEVAAYLDEVLAAVGRPKDLLAHIGGDDFILIAPPERAEAFCRRIVAGFSARIDKFYAPEDRERGSFYGKDREGILRRFPLITVTIAIVTDNGSRFANPLAMAEVAAQVKEYAKTLPGNNYASEKDLKQT